MRSTILVNGDEMGIKGDEDTRIYIKMQRLSCIKNE